MKYFDLHCDTIGECHLQKQPLYRNHLHLDLSRGAEFSAWTQCFAIWIPDEMRGQQALDYFKAVHQTYVRECAQNKTLVTAWHMWNCFDSGRRSCFRRKS